MSVLRKLYFNNLAAGDEKLSILIVGDEELVSLLALAMRAYSERQYNNEIIIKVGGSIEAILTSDCPNSVVDFVIILANTSMRNDVDEVRKNISLLGMEYIASRTFIVNATCESCSPEMARQLFSLCNEFGIPCTNSQVLDKEVCKYLAQRLLDVSVHATGYKGPGLLLVPTPVHFAPTSIMEDSTISY